MIVAIRSLSKVTAATLRLRGSWASRLPTRSGCAGAAPQGLGPQPLVAGGQHGPDLERPVELVEGRGAKRPVGRRAQRDLVRDVNQRAEPGVDLQLRGAGERRRRRAAIAEGERAA